MNQFATISDYELNGLIAIKIMGYIPAKGMWWLDGEGNQLNCSIDKATEWVYEYEGGLTYEGKQYCSHVRYNWEPTKNMKTCYQVEEEICLLGLQDEYINNLISIVTKDDREFEKSIYELVHASPRKRCEAMLMAVGTSV